MGILKLSVFAQIERILRGFNSNWLYKRLVFTSQKFKLMQNWRFLKENVHFCDGSWRDVYVQNVQVTDWQKWVEYVNRTYRVEWYNGLTEQIETQINFEVIRQYWEGEHDLCSSGSVFLNTIKLNVHFLMRKRSGMTRTLTILRVLKIIIA